MPNRWKPNVTVAAVIERDGRFLLVEEDTSDGIRLNNPAGHLDPGESPIQACVREVLEETAFDFKPTAMLGVYMNRFVRTRSGTDTTYMRFSFTGTLGTFHEGQPLDVGIRRRRGGGSGGGQDQAGDQQQGSKGHAGIRNRGAPEFA